LLGACWGILCVLLIGLWVRSYWSWSILEYTNSQHQVVGVAWNWGRVSFGTSAQALARTAGPGWEYETQDFFPQFHHPEHLGFEFEKSPGHWAVVAPFWFVVPAIATVAALPWAKRRFSLRTVLIAMKLIGALLGIAAWSIK